MATLADKYHSNLAVAPGEGGALHKDTHLSGFGLIPLVTLVLCVAAFAVPTMIFVAEESWSTEQGAHGPIVLMTGAWLLARLFPAARQLIAPPPLWRVAALLALFIPLYILSRVTQIVEVEGYVMYAGVLSVLYSVLGGPAMKRLWFPLFYLAFMFPPPETLVAAVTLPMKAGVSQAAVGFLSFLDYPISNQGVTIYIGQYQLLVAAACSGLNSIVSLSAISLFYIYMRHQANWKYSLVLTLFTVPVALLANFFRVLILILLTYHAGEAAAQGFLHNFAGISMFAVALVAIVAIDSVLMVLWSRMGGSKGSSPLGNKA